MRNWLWMLWALCLGACSPKAEEIVLVFDVENKTASEVVLAYDIVIHRIPLDDRGHAEFTLRNTDALFAGLYYGEEVKQVYLEKGDRVQVRFDGRDFKGTFVFDGEKAPAVAYLNEMVFAPLPDEEYGLPWQDFLERLAQKEREYLQLLHARQLDACGKFVKMEEGRIRYMFGGALLMYPVGHLFLTQDTAYRAGEEYYATIREWMVENEDWVDLKEYRDFMCEAAHVVDEANREVGDVYPKIVAEMRYLAEHVQSDKIRQRLLNGLASRYVDQYGIRDITEMENIYKTYVKDTALQAFYRVRFDRWDISSPGKPSPDFHAVDVEGKSYALKDFRGKYLYIDLWATWCAPCKQELPFLRQLEERFRGRNITFLGLSIDHNKAAWEEKVKSGELAGVQLWLGRRSAFQQAYNIEGIPRFLLIDPEGKIVNNNMTRPSSDDVVGVLEALPGI